MTNPPSSAATAIAGAMLPRGDRLSGADAAVLAEIYRNVAELWPAAPRYLDRLCQGLDLLALSSTGRRFQRLPHQRQQALIQRWYNDPGNVGRLTTLVSAAFKLGYFGRAEIHDLYGVTHDKAPAQPEPEPDYMGSQVLVGHEAAEDDDELEADVIVVGSGAAGAIVAKELAERGHAVLLVEQGAYFRRHHFTGQVIQAFRDFYGWNLDNVALGNATIGVPTGKTVGGSTTINTATCFRPHAWVHAGWERRGLPQLSEAAMAPLFDELEAALQIAPVPDKLLGRHVKLMAAAAEARGYSHRPMDRNAPDCDGQNCCDLGCPSGGKNSMDRSYVPMALRHGALLLTETKLERVLIRHRRVRGVQLVSGGKRFSAFARRVVLCCGTLATPQILWDHDLGGAAVGHNLTVQPSLSTMAQMSEPVNGFGDLVPSSYCIDQFQGEGIMLISANVPLDFGAITLQLVGDELMARMEAYDHLGTWGALLAETSRGRMQRLPGSRRTVMRYSLNRADVTRLQRYLALIGELYFEAGARRLYPAVRGWGVLRDRVDLAHFAAARLDAADLMISAYHPTGTCIMGRDPARSVVGPDYALREVAGLSVVDGSVIPGPLGVNSQLTVMAFALQAAGILHRQLEEDQDHASD
jgi:choline dehydrogenase-like flavoprotein